MLPYLAAGPAASFDLVFVDPPYNLPDADLLAVLTGLVPLLTEDALVCVERSTRDGAPSLPEGLVLDRTRAYGETAVHYLSPA
ncbi:RsmD family RNA methyltransferase [Streptomyces sp. L7]|uniref:RsmD family RNA methyltransferase n=1 Tax=Streptomyces sp. L7 TaxID=3423954 RepID=UPI003D9791E7